MPPRQRSTSRPRRRSGRARAARASRSRSGPLVTTTSRAPAGSATGPLSPDHRGPQAAQPLLRKASNVGGDEGPRAILTGSPAGVCPARSATAAPAAAAAPAGTGAGEPPGSSSAASRRRISAWLRSSATTNRSAAGQQHALDGDRDVAALTAYTPPAPASSSALRPGTGVLPADQVVDRQRRGAIQARDRARVLAHDHPAHHGGDARDLGVALSVAEDVASDPALVTAAVRAVAAARVLVVRQSVAVDVVADALIGAQSTAGVVRAHPPAAGERALRAAVDASGDLAAERGPAVGAAATCTIGGPDRGQRGARVEEVPERRDGQRRPRRARSARASSGASLSAPASVPRRSRGLAPPDRRPPPGR